MVPFSRSPPQRDPSESLDGKTETENNPSFPIRSGKSESKETAER